MQDKCHGVGLSCLEQLRRLLIIYPLRRLIPMLWDHLTLLSLHSTSSTRKLADTHNHRDICNVFE